MIYITAKLKEAIQFDMRENISHISHIACLHGLRVQES